VTKPGCEVEVVAVEGGATEDELAAVARALKELVDDERRHRARSVWRRASRAQGRRLGMFDYRDRFSSADAWRLSTRFPFGGREYPGRWGRGDSK
jgi:hypothetical protein